MPFEAAFGTMQGQAAAAKALHATDFPANSTYCMQTAKSHYKRHSHSSGTAIMFILIRPNYSKE